MLGFVAQRIFWCHLGLTVKVTKHGKFRDEEGVVIAMGNLYKTGRLTLFLEAVGIRKDFHYSVVQPLSRALTDATEE